MDEDLEVHRLLFDRRLFDVSDAKEWARENGYSSARAKIVGRQIEIQQSPVSSFREGTYRQAMMDSGVIVVMAERKKRGRSRKKPKKAPKAHPKKFSWKDPLGWIAGQIPR